MMTVSSKLDDEEKVALAKAGLAAFQADLQTWMVTVPLQHGVVVALHSPVHNRFVRLINGKVDTRGGCKDKDSLPLGWYGEMFLVVQPPSTQFPANKSLVALYNVHSKRYICTQGKGRVGAGEEKELDDPLREEEVFDCVTVEKTLRYCKIALRSPVTDSYMSVLDTNGPIDMHAKEILAWEHLEIIPISLAPSEGSHLA